jgi:hypothetical protein
MAPRGVLPRRLAGAAALASLALVAVLLRAHNLGAPTLWTDEAESAINGLTVLAEGVPADHYLGQPLYENTLVRPWPESPEYEFRDISYSDRGLAVYHGWLPLYAIAVAFRLAGVTPDEARQGAPLRDVTAAEIRRWTAVPRWPALAFNAVFVLAAYGLGRATHGPSLGGGSRSGPRSARSSCSSDARPAITPRPSPATPCAPSRSGTPAGAAARAITSWPASPWAWTSTSTP